MKIRALKSWTVHIPYAPPVGPYVGRGGGGGTLGGTALIVRVDTDDGLTGWGEGTARLEPAAVDLLTGRRADDVEGALAALKAAGAGPGPASGVEMALWDLLGQARRPARVQPPRGAPARGGGVHGLHGPEGALGVGGHGPRVRRPLGLHLPQDQGRQRPRPGPGLSPRRWSGRSTARPSCGPTPTAATAPKRAFEVMQRMKAVGVNRFEDPCDGQHAEVLVRCRQEAGMEILVNQGVTGPESAVPLLASGAGDYLMPDTPAAGGLLPVQKVARVAEGFGVPCLMHCSHDLGLKTVAITHLAASTPNFSGPSDTCYHGLVDDVLAEPLVFRQGRIAVPDGPGLGVDVDEEKLERYST